MKEKIAIIAILANVFLFIGKVIVGLLTNSAAILAEGIDSGVDIIASLISGIGIKISKKPVDKEHPYGYYKFEVLSGLIITLILFFTGGGIVYKSVLEFKTVSEIDVGYLSLGIMLLSAVINEIMASLKIRYGKEENSVGLISDGLHSRIDVWRSIGVFFGLILSDYWIYADRAIAIVVGLYIIKESFRIGKEVVDSLLDASANDKDENKIKEIVKKHNLVLSDLKTQKKGSIITANLKIKLDKEINIERATKIMGELKEDLLLQVKKLEYVFIQIEEGTVLSYFKPKEIGLKGFKGFGWKKKKEGRGPQGLCVCNQCNYSEKHKPENPCSQIKCPQCGKPLRRQ